MPCIQLLGQNAFPGGAAGSGRARQATYQRAVGQPGQRPALHGRAANIENRQCPEQLAKPIDTLVQQALDRFGCAVAPGKAGTAGDQHHLHLFIGNPAGHLSADLVQVVLEQRSRHQPVTDLDRAVGQQRAGSIVVVGTGVADSQHGDVQRYEDRIKLDAHGEAP
ncbi:hypothetical protein D3C76_1295260 [compost metagenome]